MSNGNDRLNIEQHRSIYAYKQANRTNKSGNYDSNVKKFPAYVQTNGLIYTFAFMLSKEKEWKSVIEDIDGWFSDEPQEILKGKLAGKKLSEVIFSDTLEDKDIRITTMETLALFTWLRRFVKDED